MVGIELVRGCNFRCRMCPAQAATGNQMKYMSKETAELIVKRINETDHIGGISPFGLGESLAHPDFYDIYRILNKIKRDSNTPVVLHTNASCLTGEAAYAILDIPFVTQLNISFDGWGDQESFSNLRGAHFYEVIDNVRNFMILAARKRPGLYVGTCSIYPEPQFMPSLEPVSPEDAERKLKSIFEPMGVHVAMRKLHKYNGFYVPDLYKDTDPSLLPSLRVCGGCLYLENHAFQLSWDGKVRPCCDVINEQFIVGDLHEQSFAQMINDERFIKLRHEMRLDNRAAYMECKNCDKFSFGDDIKAAADYWEKRILSGEITDPQELQYLEGIVKTGKER